uniref:uncharacterized protein C21orf58 homolog isoform X7 n=1 Tax=Podarcis muralis TaxID=64176 RepID=UPI00109F6704|nr:uncharacterized protein C21orf58 homolog isoform X7 [Podarcis muralis]XP_028559622.1 uncharacterized protein C21orf58 homolog isoform X7 [Podarcis muralis]
MTDSEVADHMTRLKLKLLEKKLENERENIDDLESSFSAANPWANMTSDGDGRLFPTVFAGNYGSHGNALQSALRRRKDLLQQLRESLYIWYCRSKMFWKNCHYHVACQDSRGSTSDQNQNISTKFLLLFLLLLHLNSHGLSSRQYGGNDANAKCTDASDYYAEHDVEISAATCLFTSWWARSSCASPWTTADCSTSSKNREVTTPNSASSPLHTSRDASHPISAWLFHGPFRDATWPWHATGRIPI